MSELQSNAGARDSSLPEDSLLTELPPVREGLPAGYRMRAEAHYVDDLADRAAGPVIRMIATHAIQSDQALGRIELDPLIRSIATHGVLQPLLVRGDGPPYTTVAGRNRLEAARLAGLTSVPCVILPIDAGESDALGHADNLRCASAEGTEDDERVRAAADGFRQNLRRHMSTIQTAMTLSAGDDPITRQVGFDLAQTNAYRGAWMLDAQQLVERAPMRSASTVAVSSAIDQVKRALAPEFRLAGVALHVTFAEGVGSDSVDEHVIGVALTGAIVALLPVVDLGDRPVMQIRTARVQASTTIEVSCVNVTAPRDWIRRLFDDSWTDRPGTWEALLGAMSVKAGAERLGGDVTVTAPPHGGVALKIRIPRRAA